MSNLSRESIRDFFKFCYEEFGQMMVDVELLQGKVEYLEALNKQLTEKIKEKESTNHADLVPSN
jgi:hypothetical protein